MRAGVNYLGITECEIVICISMKDTCGDRRSTYPASRILLACVECALAAIAVTVYHHFAVDLKGVFIVTLSIGTIIGLGVGLLLRKPISGAMIGFCLSVAGFALLMWLVISTAQAG